MDGLLSARANFEASVQDHHHGTGRLIQTNLFFSARNISLSEVSGFKEIAQPWYSDQILPFDITLCGTNEVGAATTMKIFGVEILNEGSGVSIDDAAPRCRQRSLPATSSPGRQYAARTSASVSAATRSALASATSSRVLFRY
jgi:hypothetical protein